MATEKKRAPALIVMDDSPDLAQRVLSVMRNRGVVVHTHHADNMESLARLLDTVEASAVILQLQQERIERPAQVRKQLTKYPTVPFILLLDSVNCEGLCDALGAVPDAVVDEEEDDQLVTVVQRLVTARDEIQQLETSKARLDELEERYNLLLESSREAIAYIHEGLHIYANSAYLELFGYEAFDDIEGVSLIELLKSEDGSSDVRTLLKRLGQGELPETAGVYIARTANDDTFPCTIEFSYSRYNSEACTQLLVRQRVDEVDPALAIELEKLKTTDLITGMYNRQAFMQKLVDMVENADDTSEYALLFVELDRYEKMLDNLGVTAAEKVIAEAAKLLQSCMQESVDLSCRYGDHTFAFFVKRDDRDGIALTTKCCLEKISEKPLELEEDSVPATCSVGYTYLAGLNRSADLLLSQAISAWQEAVKEGGSRDMLYRPRQSSDEGDDKIRVWAERLRHALDNNQLLLATTPITNMEDEGEQLLEVIVKLKSDDNDELVDSSEFMPAAHSIGLTGEVDRFVLQRLANMQHKNPKARYFMHLSGVSLAAADFAAWMDNLIVEASGIKPSQLIMLMNPREIASNLRPAQQFMDHLGPRGVGFGLEQFGETDDGERVLQHLPVDYIRVHPKFCNKLNDKNALSRLKDVVSNAQSKQVQVIAPDVADATSLSTLWQVGITLVQGNFLGSEQMLPS